MMCIASGAVGRGLLAVALGVASPACGTGGEPAPEPVLHESAAERSATGEPADDTFQASPAADRGPLLVALGDSLTAGLGLAEDQAYPALLQRRLHHDGYDVTVVNAGVSGDTSAAGWRRAAWSVEGDVRILIVALGGNDGLRGLPVDQMKQNLSRIVSLARERGIAVLLAGMEAPPNFGSIYTAQFRDAFREVAHDFDLTLMPFLLDGVAADPSFNQSDGIHPNAAGAEIVADRVYDALPPLLSVLPAATR